MRILLVSTEYPPETRGGIGSYVSCTARALARRGHEVHVLSCVRGQRSSDTFDEAVHVHRRPQSRTGMGRLFKNAPQAASRVNTAVATWISYLRLKINFDVIEVPDWGAEGFCFALAGSKPLVGQLHTPLTLIARYSGTPLGRDGQWANLLERCTMRRCDSLSSPSATLVRALGSWLPATPVQIIRSPIDIEAWASSDDAGRSAPVVLQVGRLEPLKDPLTLVNAAARLADRVPGVRAVFIGRSIGERQGVGYRAWLERHAASIGAPCQFVDQVPRHELPDWYWRARVLALPSLFENFPMVALEAMSASRPLVVSERTGASEMVRGSECGTVFPPGDDRALAEALLPYLADPAEAARAGREARRIVAAGCAPDRVAEQREALYRLTIERWERRRGDARAA